jgi:preprotein translocase subunit SecG
MPWYTYILLFVYVICCALLIVTILLQPGKGDIAAAFGGGGLQNAFGPRGAASTLGRATLVLASAFMILSFVFAIPGISGKGSVAEDIADEPPAPTQPANKSTTPPNPLAPAPGTNNNAAPAATDGKAATGEEKSGSTPEPVKPSAESKPAATDSNDTKSTDAKEEPKK